VRLRTEKKNKRVEEDEEERFHSRGHNLVESVATVFGQQFKRVCELWHFHDVPRTRRFPGWHEHVFAVRVTLLT
jgi:hypothetical protein